MGVCVVSALGVSGVGVRRLALRDEGAWWALRGPSLLQLCMRCDMYEMQ